MTWQSRGLLAYHNTEVIHQRWKYIDVTVPGLALLPQHGGNTPEELEIQMWQSRSLLSYHNTEIIHRRTWKYRCGSPGFALLPQHRGNTPEVIHQRRWKYSDVAVSGLALLPQHRGNTPEVEIHRHDSAGACSPTTTRR